MKIADKLNKNKIILPLLIIFVVVYSISRLPMISRDEINPDAVNWHYRSQQFIVGLKSGQFDKTYQHYHPGVTLMWITGVPIELYKQLTGITTYTSDNFYNFHLWGKLGLFFTLFALTLLVMYFINKIADFKTVFIVTIILSFEPFFLANSRIFHMDTLISLLVFLTLLIYFWALKTNSTRFFILSGILCGFSFLTRSVMIGLFLYLFLFTVIGNFVMLKRENIKKNLTSLLISFILTTFIFFPALWVKPIFVIQDIFSEGERIGIRDGHEQIFFGSKTDNPGFLFYPIVLLLKISPFMLVGLVLSKFKLVIRIKENFLNANVNSVYKSISEHFLYFAGIFYAGYFIVMSFPSKKLDRYMIVLWPFMAVLTYIGYKYLYTRISAFRQGLGLFLAVSGLLYIVYVLVPAFKIFPYYFTYTSPIFGSTQSANKIIGQKPFGIGIARVKDYFLINYEDLPEIGMIDTKPIKSVYPNSRVSDIRVNGPGSYEIIVLGINEVMPEKVLESGIEFEEIHSININGLEYWRIYAKKK